MVVVGICSMFLIQRFSNIGHEINIGYQSLDFFSRAFIKTRQSIAIGMPSYIVILVSRHVSNSLITIKNTPFDFSHEKIKQDAQALIIKHP